MSLLSNVEIKSYIDDQKGFVVASADGGVHFAPRLLQPASMDMTVGEIFLPPDKDDDQQRVIPFKDHFNLGVGSTVLVRSEQRLCLPSDIGGFVFPKNGHFALKGVLITNFGHIDPGFEGHLKFTVINMGRNEFSLEVGKTIACVVLFRMGSPAKPDWKDLEHGSADSDESHARVLPRAFMDLDTSVSRIVKDLFKTEWQNRERLSFWSTFGAATLGALLAVASLVWALVYPFVQTTYDKTIATNIEVGKLQNQIDTLKSKLPQ